MGNLKSGVYSKKQKRVRIRPIKHAKMAQFFSVKLYKMAQKVNDFIETEHNLKGRDSLKETLGHVLAFDKLANTWLKVVRGGKKLKDAQGEEEQSYGDLLLDKGEGDDK